jgi:hypothetical protein
MAEAAACFEDLTRSNSDDRLSWQADEAVAELVPQDVVRTGDRVRAGRAHPQAIHAVDARLDARTRRDRAASVRAAASW